MAREINFAVRGRSKGAIFMPPRLCLIQTRRAPVQVGRALAAIRERMAGEHVAYGRSVKGRSVVEHGVGQHLNGRLVAG